MDGRAPWLGLTAVCLVVVGPMLAFERRIRYYPALVAVAVCLALLAVVLARDASPRR